MLLCAGAILVFGLVTKCRSAIVCGVIVGVFVLVWYETIVGVLIVDGTKAAVVCIHAVDESGSPIPDAVVTVFSNLELRERGAVGVSSATDSNGCADIVCKCSSVFKESLLWRESAAFVPMYGIIEIRSPGRFPRDTNFQEILGETVPVGRSPIRRQFEVVLKRTRGRKRG